MTREQGGGFGQLYFSLHITLREAASRLRFFSVHLLNTLINSGIAVISFDFSSTPQITAQIICSLGLFSGQLTTDNCTGEAFGGLFLAMTDNLSSKCFAPTNN